MTKKFSTPIDDQVRKIAESRNRFNILSAFNDLVEELIKTDKHIENMPEGEEKRTMLKAQEEAWALLMSQQMCDSIMLEE